MNNTSTCSGGRIDGPIVELSIVIRGRIGGFPVTSLDLSYHLSPRRRLVLVIGLVPLRTMACTIVSSRISRSSSLSVSPALTSALGSCSFVCGGLAARYLSRAAPRPAGRHSGRSGSSAAQNSSIKMSLATGVRASETKVNKWYTFVWWLRTWLVVHALNSRTAGSGTCPCGRAVARLESGTAFTGRTGPWRRPGTWPSSR